MAKVNVSPGIHFNERKEFLKELSILFTEVNIPKIEQHLAEDIHWNLVGDRIMKGKDAFIQLLEEMKGSVTQELNFDAMITHGKEAAIHGSILMENGSRYRFADFYVFTGSKGKTISSLTSYVIELKEK